MTPNESPAALLLEEVAALLKRNEERDRAEFVASLERLLASTAPGASESRGSVPDGFELVPKDALDWLFGEAGIFECPPSSYFHGKPPTYWWRSEFRKRIAAAPTLPAVASGEPTAEHWKEAIMLWYAKPRAGLAWDWIESVAYQLLARSAAAKGGRMSGLSIRVICERTADVPQGPLCVNWAYRFGMPIEQNFRCSELRDESMDISASVAQSAGLGLSGGRTHAFRCALFDASLSHEFGVGVTKCRECAEQEKPR